MQFWFKCIVFSYTTKELSRRKAIASEAALRWRADESAALGPYAAQEANGANLPLGRGHELGLARGALALKRRRKG